MTRHTQSSDPLLPTQADLPPTTQSNSHQHVTQPLSDLQKRRLANEEALYASLNSINSLIFVSPVILCSCLFLNGFAGAFGGAFVVMFFAAGGSFSLILNVETSTQPQNRSRQFLGFTDGDLLAWAARWIVWWAVWSISLAYVWGLAIVWWNGTATSEDRPSATWCDEGRYPRPSSKPWGGNGTDGRYGA